MASAPAAPRAQPRRTAPGRLQHAVGLIDDARYAVMLRERIDEISDAMRRRVPALGPARNLPAVAAILRRLGDELGQALRSCSVDRPVDGGRHVECAEALLDELDACALAVQELAAVHAELDDALRALGLVGHRGLPTFRGLYHAIDVVAHRVIADGVPRRALGIAHTVRRELAALRRPDDAVHRCERCRGAGTTLPGDDAARLDALRAAGHGALASRLACDLAARRGRQAADGSAGPASRRHAELVQRSERVAAQARAGANAPGAGSRLGPRERTQGHEEQDAGQQNRRKQPGVRHQRQPRARRGPRARRRQDAPAGRAPR